MTEERADQIIAELIVKGFSAKEHSSDLRLGQAIWGEAIKSNRDFDSLIGTNKDCFNNDHNIDRFLKAVKEILLSEKDFLNEKELKSYLYIKQKIQDRGDEIIDIYSDTIEKVTAIFDDIYKDVIAYTGVEKGEPFEIILKAKYLTMTNEEVRKDLREIWMKK